jgi:hypothetical protein
MVHLRIRRSFIQESKHQKHLHDRTVLMIIHFLNHAIVINEEQFILNKTFPQDIFSFLNSFISYYTLYPIYLYI